MHQPMPCHPMSKPAMGVAQAAAAQRARLEQGPRAPSEGDSMPHGSQMRLGGRLRTSGRPLSARRPSTILTGFRKRGPGGEPPNLPIPPSRLER